VNRLIVSSLFCTLITVSFSLSAQPRALDEALGNRAVQAALQQITDTRLVAAQQLVGIGGIISPSGQEHERAAAVAQLMRDIGLQNVQMTESPNVIGIIPGSSGQALVFVSTLDDLATVAEHQRAAGTLPVIDGERVVGPGTNTSLTTIAMLAAAKALIDQGFVPQHDLVFAAVSTKDGE
jgi:acetylornithine deacetylase/succinyl-diaminopimelate desuccinylase-like protein